jgi:hypothetical protein
VRLGGTVNTMVPAVSQSEIDLRADFSTAIDLGLIGEQNDLRLRLARGTNNVWVVLEFGRVERLAIRVGVNSGAIARVEHFIAPDGAIEIEFMSAIGAMRSRVDLIDSTTVHCTTSVFLAEELRTDASDRDVLMLAGDGTVHTSQRGLRSGIVFASARGDAPLSLFYFQNFSGLTDYFTETKRTPADTVGGTWPLLGYAAPAGDDCFLPAGREFVVSDAFITLSQDAPTSEEALAALYLDMFARTYLALERPEAAYHPWPDRAAETFRDLTTSPLCTYNRQGRQYLMPYVADETKPPESMVQFTVAVNLGEYDRWRGAASRLQPCLRSGVASFFNDEVGSIVRWLPGESFDDAQADDNMSHEAMDSWYLHHSLFNAYRFGREGDADAKRFFERSLPYLMRVAHRFNYRWPIFFHLKTLDIIRAEAAPGEGGETDVAGIYALVMIHAYEMFGAPEYLQEAEIAASHLHGFGFSLAYQLNTTGFAAEGALRLWKVTGKKRYLHLAELCLANLFDNMWLWQCPYEHARNYRTFFGLFPLRDAPYLAPYEELEAHAKFHEYLELAGDDARPSLRLLIAEYQRYSLDRCWYYYPTSLPADSIADKARNGYVERALAIPLEDLQDGREKSGQVGQEIYGAGLAFVLVARHYQRFAGGKAFVYANYPMYEFTETTSGHATWRAGGDPRCSGELRVFPSEPELGPQSIRVWALGGDGRLPLHGMLSPEGHAVFAFRGGQTLEIECSASGDVSAETVIIGAPEARSIS